MQAKYSKYVAMSRGFDMTLMRVTHRVSGGGPRLAELVAGSGIVKVEGVGVLLLASFGAHGTDVAAVDSSETVDVTDADLAARDRILAGREKTRRRMLEAGMSDGDVTKYFGGPVALG